MCTFAQISMNARCTQTQIHSQLFCSTARHRGSQVSSQTASWQAGTVSRPNRFGDSNEHPTHLVHQDICFFWVRTGNPTWSLKVASSIWRSIAFVFWVFFRDSIFDKVLLTLTQNNVYLRVCLCTSQQINKQFCNRIYLLFIQMFLI